MLEIGHQTLVLFNQPNFTLLGLALFSLLPYLQIYRGHDDDTNCTEKYYDYSNKS